MIRVLTVLGLMIFVSACANKKIAPDPTNVTTAKGVISFWGAWVKDKGDKFDINLHVQNEDQDQGIIIYLSDIRCSHGGRRGEIKHTFFNTGERTIDFRPGEKKAFNLVCRTGSDGRGGEILIGVDRVYSNPGLDGRTVGKVIAKGLVWKHSSPK